MVAFLESSDIYLSLYCLFTLETLNFSNYCISKLRFYVIMLRYSRKFLWNLRFWWKDSSLVRYDQFNSEINHPSQPVHPTIWNVFKAMGLLRRFRSARNKHFTRSLSAINHIQPRITTRPFQDITKLIEPKRANLTNLIKIQVGTPSPNASLNNDQNNNCTNTLHGALPCFCLINARSLRNKIDEFHATLLTDKIDIAAVRCV